MGRIHDQCRIDDSAALAPGDRDEAPTGHAIAFGPFRLLPARRLLLQGEEPVRLGSRALEILIALVTGMMLAALPRPAGIG